MERSQRLIDLARPLPVTFHRAFDMLKDPEACLEVLVGLGVERVLTSGHDSSTLEGVPMLKKLVKAARGRIVVAMVPGERGTSGGFYLALGLWSFIVRLGALVGPKCNTVLARALLGAPACHRKEIGA